MQVLFQIKWQEKRTLCSLCVCFKTVNQRNVFLQYYLCFCVRVYISTSSHYESQALNKALCYENSGPSPVSEINATVPVTSSLW